MPRHSIYAGIQTTLTREISGAQAFYFYQGAPLAAVTQALNSQLAYACVVSAAWALGSLLLALLLFSNCPYAPSKRPKHRD